MKIKCLFIPVLFITLANWGCTKNEMKQLKFILLNAFPENIWFESADYETRFHRPEIEISAESLFLAYIKEEKDKETGQTTFQKIERHIPFRTITENYTFEFHLGQADRQYPGIHYRYFKVAENCNETKKENCTGARSRIYVLDTEDWNKPLSDGTAETGGDALEWNHFWFPTDPKSEKELDHVLKAILRR